MGGASHGTSARGSVQASFVPMREMGPNYVTLEAPMLPGKRSYSGVLEVRGVNYLLKSEEEQRLLNDVFRVVLASLSYPLRILIRVQPFALDTYLAQCAPAAPASQAWTKLALSYRDFVEACSERRPLMQRRFYLIVPSGSQIDDDEAGSYLQHVWQHLGGNRRQREAERSQALQQLDVRCHALMRQLSAMGLSSVQRLEGAELAAFEYQMLSPKRARKYPLRAEWFEGLEQPLMQHRAAPTVLPFQFDAADEGKQRDRRGNRGTTRAEQPARFRWPELADVLAPVGVHLTPSMLCLDDEWVQVLDVSALPRRVSPGWLNRLADLDVPVDICLNYTPLSTGSTMRQLQRKRFEVASTNELNRDRGKLQPDRQVVQTDIEDMMTRIAAKQDRLLAVSMRFVVRGDSQEEVSECTATLQANLHSMLLGCRPCLFEQDRAFRSCLPHGRDELRDSSPPFVMASHEASSTFPFLSHSFIQDGILEGITLQGNEPILSDWWHEEQRNANRLFVAPSGAGKSFKAKLDTIRSHLWYGQRHRLSREAPLRYQTLIVDVEREYTHVTHLLDGVCLRVAPGTTHFLNPFDLPRRGNSSGGAVPLSAASRDERGEEDVLAEKVAQLQALLGIMLAEQTEQGVARLSNREKGLLDQALFACYVQKGITRHPDTHHLPPPLLADLYDVLAAKAETVELAHRLHRYVHGSLAGLFAGQTNVSLETAPVVCFDIHDVPMEMRAMVLFLISSIVWNLSFGSAIPRQFIVDELLTIYQYEEGKQFVESLFQRARKHYLSVVGITQYPKLLLDSTIPTNCATTVLMAQELASLPLISDLFQLSEREMEMVRGFGKGEALLFSNDHRFAVRFEASAYEYGYCSSDPVDRAFWSQSGGQ